MQNIRKILRTVSDKTALPTNQPTNRPIITNNTDLIGPRWRRSNQKLKHILAWKLLIKTCLDVFYENGLLLL